MWSDKDALLYFLNLQNSIEPTMAIEVGAHDADFAKLVSKRGIPTYAFEASTDVYEKYKDGMERVTYINKAVTNYDGCITFKFNGDRLPKENVGNHSIKVRNINEIVETVEVPCVTLDSYFKDIQDQRIALWIDCEGANREVLEGSRNILSMTNSIFIEVEHKQIWVDSWTRTDVINYLESFGFNLIKEFPAYTNQTNCIFIR